MSRKISNKINKTSEKSNALFFKRNNIEENLQDKFTKIVTKEVSVLKDCSERSIINFYQKEFLNLLNKNYDFLDDKIWDILQSNVRKKLSYKYTSKKTFDNNIDIYFNEVKREYILHPQTESEDLEFNEENKDIFIKNNLKLVIECARRYQNLGLPFEDLIQIGNIGLLTAFEKFDSDRANLRFAILKNIDKSNLNSFSNEEATNIIKKSFSYAKSLDLTLSKIPENGFKSKEEFKEWTSDNVKKASFASISFMWIRATIIAELNKLGKIVRVPKVMNKDVQNPLTVIRLDSINPHTEDNYYDNVIFDTTMDDFIIEDEYVDKMERQNVFKSIIGDALNKLSLTDKRIIKKRFGIDMPYELSINEISESECLPVNKVKYSITNSLKTISESLSEENKKIIFELLQ